MTTISMASAIAVGHADIAASKPGKDGTVEFRPVTGAPDVHLGDLIALLAFCRVQIVLHARNAPYEARTLLEGGPDEDGAKSLTIAAYQRVQDACALWEREEAA